VAVESGKLVTAQSSAILREPTSKLQVASSHIDIIAGSSPVLQLTVHNTGMDAISIIAIECDRPLPVQLWSSDGHEILLQPNEEKIFTIQLDSLDYIAPKHQNADGTFSHQLPQHGSTKLVTVNGENSLGRPIRAVAAATVSATQVQEVPDPEPTPTPVTNEFVGTKLPMGEASIQIHDAGHYTVSFVVVNVLFNDVKVSSLRVNGADIPGWDGMSLLARTTMSSKVTTSQGITNSDIGSTVEIVLVGQISGGPQAAQPVYGVTSARVYGP
jgi:hypothetical protein